MLIESREFQQMLSGGCLCGGVRYQLARAPEALSICHCSMCRKTSGGAAMAVVPVAAADFELSAGQALIREYESSPGKWRGFCGRCGSPLYSRRDALPQTLRLRFGSVDGDPARPPRAFHIMVGSRAGWDCLPDDGLPRYDGLEPGRAPPTPGADPD